MSSFPLPGSRWSWALIPGFLAIAAVAFTIAARVAERRMEELAWLRSVPRADVASPTEGPARYVGKLHGPKDRGTPAGNRAAAYWWAVAYRDSDGPDTVYCSARERSLLVLETPGRSVRLAFTEADPNEVGVIDDQKDNEYDMPVSIDLGSTRRARSEEIPPGTCTGGGAKYEESIIAEGADVEVVGCMSAGALAACNTPLRAVLAVPDLEVHRRHRVDEAKVPFRAAIIAVALVLVYVGIVFAAMASVDLRTARSGKSE